jgi:hypothetical protein
MRDTKTPKHHRAWVPRRVWRRREKERGTRKEHAGLWLGHLALRPAHNLRSLRANSWSKAQLSRSDKSAPSEWRFPRKHSWRPRGEGLGTGNGKLIPECSDSQSLGPRNRGKKSECPGLSVGLS